MDNDELQNKETLVASIEASHETMRIELKRPTPFTGDYQLKVNGNGPIEAIGYGNLRKEYPLELMQFQRRAPLPHDVVIEILYCGVCHSDWHVIKDDWKNSKYPIITGHEIIGTVVRVGNKVTSHKVGDTVALGPNFSSCLECSQCDKGQEQYCLNEVTETYNMPDRYPGELKATGPVTQGGYSNVIVADEHFVLSVPKGADLPKSAPLVCAGATMYTPLKTLGIKEGHRVGIAGYGGLGNIGVKLAKSTGAEVIVFTRTPAKMDDALAAGADQVIWELDLDMLTKYNDTFDLIICTVPFRHDVMPFVELLKPNGTAWVLGAMVPLTVDLDRVNRRGKILRGSSTAGIGDTQECVNYCVKNKIYPDIQLIGINDLNATHEKLLLSQARYRYVVDMTTIYQ